MVSSRISRNNNYLRYVSLVLVMAAAVFYVSPVQGGGNGGSGFSMADEDLQDLFPSWNTDTPAGGIQPVQPPPRVVVPQNPPPVRVYPIPVGQPAAPPPAVPVRPQPVPSQSQKNTADGRPGPGNPNAVLQKKSVADPAVSVAPAESRASVPIVSPSGKPEAVSVDAANADRNKQTLEQTRPLPESEPVTGKNVVVTTDSELLISQQNGHTIYRLTDEAAETIQNGMGAADFFTLEKCIAIALEVNPDVMNAAWSIKGAEWEKDQASAVFLPSARLRYSYSLLDQTPTSHTQGRTIVVGHRQNYSVQTSISQPIFTGFSLLSQYELARLGLNTAEIKMSQARLDLILKTKQYYYLLLQAQKNLEVARQSEEQLEAHLKDARQFFEVGLVPKIQVLEAEVKLAQTVQDRNVAENDLEYTRARLNTLLRRPLHAPIEVLDVTNPVPTGRPLNDCLAEALLNRPEILVAERQIDVSRQNVRLAASEYFPDVSLSYNYEKEGDTWEVGGAQFKDSSSWNVAAEANWTIWDWGRTHKGVQAKKTEIHKAYNTLDQVKEAVVLEVKQSYLSLESASKNIVVSEKAVEQAEENYRLNNERYREQIATSTEVTDAQTLLTQARISYYNALYQLALAKASLERAMGLEEIGS